jgi:hypothetical protein
MRRMANSRWPEYAVMIGSTVMLGATVLTLILLAIDQSTHSVSSVLGFEFPIALLAAVLGVLVALIGTVGWAFRLPSQTLAGVGILLVGLAIVFFLRVNQVTFGFDDPTALFAVLIVFAPGLIGVVCLVFAVARRVRASR